MKTNLDSLYKTNSSMEKEGIWVMISTDVGFLLRRFGGANNDKLKLALAKYHKPYARQIEKGTLDSKLEEKLMTTAFVESCIADWKGVEIDGKETEFSKEVAIEFFLSLPDLTNELLSQSQNVDNYREELGKS